MNSKNLIAREGISFITVAALLFAVTLLLGLAFFIKLIAFALLVFTVAFFRDPERSCPGEPNEVLCPADGRVVSVERIQNDRFLGGPSMKVDIFMSPFNVHVNRAPLAGTVMKIQYNKGKFLNAASEKASLENEQNALTMELPDGRKFAVNQIAGLVARRIVCRIRAGVDLARGERFGIIRFGSRVDIHLPPDTTMYCRVGDRVYAGDTILGVVSDGK